MEGSEELREALVALRRENDLLRTETTHAKLLLTALEAVLSVDSRDDPFAGVFSALMTVFESCRAIVLIERDGSAGELECIAADSPALVGTVWGSSRLFEKALAGRVVATISDSDVSSWPDALERDFRIGTPALHMPLGVREKRGLLLLLRAPDQPGFDRAHVALAKKFSLLASHALAARQAHQSEAESHRLKRLTEQLRISQAALSHRANHDQLTGLPNRAHIQELVDNAIARCGKGKRMALAFIDLDDFKRVNDLHGHAAGDTLLKTIADRVCARIRDTDIFGRISGDEFVIVLDDIDRRQDISEMVSRMRGDLCEPLWIDSALIRPSASIGVAFYPAHGKDYETLRRHADIAMYEAKKASKGSIAFYRRELGRRTSERQRLEQRLLRALETGAFRCALQQKVDIRSRAVVGFEALMRWIDEDGEVHAPGYFLKLASEFGLVDEMTDLVVGDLLDHLKLLDARFGTNVRYSINVSPTQATHLPFIKKLVERLHSSGRPRSFILELTEETIAAIGPLQRQVLPLLREAGIGLSIDDFGTGYSSLATLADLTVDELKIDRSLISSIHSRPRSQSILRAIESMSLALGISMVAEGVETAEESLYLMAHTRLNIGQGYLFHRPELLADILRSPQAVQRNLCG